MRARQIEVFRMVMRCGTLTGAAEALNVSQPALSQILLHTEDELGFKLFQRVKGRLIPTPEAEEIYPEVERLFGGRAAPLFAQLAESEALTDDDLAEIEAMLKELRR